MNGYDVIASLEAYVCMKSRLWKLTFIEIKHTV